MAARKGPSYQMSNAHRDKIKNSNILTALIEHAEGARDMKPSQVTAGLGLLKKVLPDLETHKHEGGEADGSIGITFKTVIERRGD